MRGENELKRIQEGMPELTAATLELFEGDNVAARRWLQTPLPVLGGKPRWITPTRNLALSMFWI